MLDAELQTDMQRAVKVTEIEPGLPMAHTLGDGRRVCLVRTDAAVYAVEDRCPHRDFALSSGDMVSPCVLECPWHGARFDVRDGTPVDGPSADPLRTYHVRIVDGVVFVGSPRSL